MKLDWNDIAAYKQLKKNKSHFIPHIDEMITYATKTLPLINKVFSNYTNHGIEHSMMTIKYMCDLISDINSLSDLELTVLIYCGLLHDIGMVITDGDIDLIKADKFAFTNFKYDAVYEKYNHELTSLQEIVRPIHGKLAHHHILNFMLDDANHLKSLFCIPGKSNISFAEEVAKICMSHNESIDWIKLKLTTDTIKSTYPINSQFIALLLRLSDLLDIDENRTPAYLYQLINPQGISNDEWLQHFAIENSEKIVVDNKTKLKTIEFHGQSHKADIHRKLLKYIDYINLQLKSSISLSESFVEEKYLLRLNPTVKNRIVTKTFSFSDFKLSLDYAAVTQLLMGENIYGDKKYGLRELIQNSIDACKLMREESAHLQAFQREPYKPYVRIEIDKDRNTVTIADNGIGMSLDILKKYFLNVGVSYYSSNEYKFRGYTHEPIGKYGIGFLSCFMLSEEVTVITRYFNENVVNTIDMEKQSEYICLNQHDQQRSQGTDIKLKFDQFTEIFPNTGRVKHFIDSNFIDDNISISIIEFEGSSTKDTKCQPTPIKNENKSIIRLDKYLNGISGYMNIKYSNLKFVKSFSDIINDDAYVYNESLLSQGFIFDELEEDMKISDYINENSISYLEIPIIDEENYEAFERAYEVLEDYDDTLDKLDYNWAYIFFDSQTTSYNDSNLLDDGDDLLGDFTVNDFSAKFEHIHNIPISPDFKEQLIVNIDCDEYLCYSCNIEHHRSYQISIYNYSNKPKNIFVRDVLLPNCILEMPFIIDGLLVDEFVFNITNPCAIPNVSRTNISSDMLREISYAVGRALHLWIYENADFDPIKKRLIKEFIDLNYNSSNPYIYDQ